jgi:hypothetical protein
VIACPSLSRAGAVFCIRVVVAIAATVTIKIAKRAAVSVIVDVTHIVGAVTVDLALVLPNDLLQYPQRRCVVVTVITWPRALISAR